MRGAYTQFNATHKVCRSKACLMLCSLLEVFLSTTAQVFTVHRFPACGKSERWVNSASWFHWISGSISPHQRQTLWQAHFKRATGNVQLLLWLFKLQFSTKLFKFIKSPRCLSMPSRWPPVQSHTSKPTPLLLLLLLLSLSLCFESKQQKGVLSLKCCHVKRLEILLKTSYLR